ncbi:MAG TPA: DsbA family protein [Chiayiivirga sp.]|nr:DsbA family protein [Chiayiivirga sp.]
MSRLRCPSILWSSILTITMLAGCGGQSPTPPETASPAPSSAAAESSPATSTSADSTAASTESTTAAADNASDTDAQPDTATSADETSAAPVAEATDSVKTPDEARPAEAASPATPAPLPEGPEPRIGVDYTLIDPPQPLLGVPGKVEIAEVFSYTCIHCARLDPLLPAWRATLPEQVNFVPVPMAYGAVESLARGFYAAKAMGVLDKTHTGMFTAVAQEHKLKSGSLDDVVKLYADLGVDAEALKATATSFAVNTQISRNQRTVTRWAIEGTPTLVVAGKYKVVATAEGGHAGMLRAARWLALKEIADRQLGAP